MDTVLILFILIAFPIFFVGLWMFVCWVLSHIGGWYTLSKSYKNQEHPQLMCVQNESMCIGFISYFHTMTFCPSSEGLSMSVMELFRICHPPLLIPWSAFHNPRPKKFLWKNMIAVDVGSPTIKTIMLPEKAYYNRYHGL